MSITTLLPVVGGLIDSLTKGLDELFTSDEEQGQVDIEKKKVELKQLALELKAQHTQLQINMVQANHPSIFVAGARPAIIWIGALGLAYEAILRPILNGLWTAFGSPDHQTMITEFKAKFDTAPSAEQIQALVDAYTFAFPSINTDLFMPIVLGVLGIGGMRTWEKLNNKARNNLGASAESVQVEAMLKDQYEQTQRQAAEASAGTAASGGKIDTGNAAVNAYNEASSKPGFKPTYVHPADVVGVDVD